MCCFSKLEHIANYKAKNKETQLLVKTNVPAHTHTHTYTHTRARARAHTLFATF